MPRFLAIFTITEENDWQQDDFFRTDKFKAQVGQNLEFLHQLHDHSGDLGDGATLVAGDDGLLFFTLPAID